MFSSAPGLTERQLRPWVGEDVFKVGFRDVFTAWHGSLYGVGLERLQCIDAGSALWVGPIVM